MTPKIPVYFMPGLAASSLIFERINLPDEFEVHLLEWAIPMENESLSAYAKRMTLSIKEENPVLIGVSFGGILVQEMAEHIKVKKVIIISSVKSNKELPLRMRIAKSTQAYKLIPVRLLANVESLAKFSFGKKINKRLVLYKKYLSIRDYKYLNWAIRSVILWERVVANPNVIHIHGDSDDVFPIKCIDNCIVVNGGTHIMILNKFRRMIDNLPDFIRT